MKITHRDPRGNELTLVPEHADDLWLLSQVIAPGDQVKATTIRKIKLEGDRRSEIIKKPITVKITVERVTWDPSGELRVSGVIVEGPEDVARGSHHTIALESGNSAIVSKKSWPHYQVKRLEEAVGAKQPIVLVCAFDREDAVFARLTTSGHEMLATLHGDVAKKRESSTTNKNFFEEIIKQAKEYVQRYEAERIIFASPAFWKDELLKSLHDPEVKKKTILATISSADERGVIEALKRPETQEALRQGRTAKEMALVEQVLSGIAKGSAIAYGFKEVRDAGSAGAVSTVLVTDGLVMRMREQGTGAELDALLASIEQQHGAVIIVSSAHDGGKKLDGLGGVAALLRYRLNV